jgi:hypothetical protein
MSANNVNIGVGGSSVNSAWRNFHLPVHVAEKFTARTPDVMVFFRWSFRATEIPLHG